MSERRGPGAGASATALAVVVAAAVGGLLGAVAGVSAAGPLAGDRPTPIDLSAVENPTYDTP